MSQSGKLLTIIFALEQSDSITPLENVIHQDEVSFYPTFQTGDQIDFSIAQSVESGVNLNEKKYKVVRTRFSVNVNSGSRFEHMNTSELSLIVYLKEVPRKPDGDFDYSFI